MSENTVSIIKFFFDKIFTFGLGLIGVYFGWQLSWKTIVKQNETEHLKHKFVALSEIKSVVDNIPPNLNKEELREKLNNDPEFRKNLIGRLVRLLGLRNELMTYIESDFVHLIDSEFRPLFNIGNGSYNFKENKIEEFLIFTEKIISYIHTYEENLRKLQKKQFQ